MRRDRRPEHMTQARCRSLRIFQHRPSALDNFEGAFCRIWSEEHRAYWRRSEAGGGAGYVACGRGAGTWSLKDAFRLTAHCGPEKQIWFEFLTRRETMALGLVHVPGKLPKGRDLIRAERDIEVAGWVDRYADAVEHGLSVGPNRLQHSDDVRGPLVVAFRGLASSIRAGLVE